jgi:hypothetical protein
MTTRHEFIDTLAGGLLAAPPKGLASLPSYCPPRRIELPTLRQGGVHVAEPHPTRGRKEVRRHAP